MERVLGSPAGLMHQWGQSAFKGEVMWEATDEQWQAAYDYLQGVRKMYVEIGASGTLALTITLNPLVMRYESGERSEGLYDEMRAVE